MMKVPPGNGADQKAQGGHAHESNRQICCSRCHELGNDMAESEGLERPCITHPIALMVPGMTKGKPKSASSPRAPAMVASDSSRRLRYTAKTISTNK
jgi:hypothetical protein